MVSYLLNNSEFYQNIYTNLDERLRSTGVQHHISKEMTRTEKSSILQASLTECNYSLATCLTKTVQRQ